MQLKISLGSWTMLYKAAAVVVTFTAALLSAGSPARADDPVEAHWLNPVSGDWTNPAMWSTDPYYPHADNPAGTTYDAFIDATGQPYEVILDSGFFYGTDPLKLHSLSLGGSDATLVLRVPLAVSSLAGQGLIRIEDGNLLAPEAGTLDIPAGIEIATANGASGGIGDDLGIINNYGTIRGTTSDNDLLSDLRLGVRPLELNNHGNIIADGGRVDLENLINHADGSVIARNGGELHLDGTLDAIASPVQAQDATVWYSIYGQPYQSGHVNLVRSTLYVSTGATLDVITPDEVLGDVDDESTIITRQSTMDFGAGTYDNSPGNVQWGAWLGVLRNGTLTGSRPLVVTGSDLVDMQINCDLHVIPNVHSREDELLGTTSLGEGITVRLGEIEQGSYRSKSLVLSSIDDMNVTVEGVGRIKKTNGPLISRGTIEARGIGNLSPWIDIDATLQNLGTLRSSNGGALLVQDLVGDAGAIDIDDLSRMILKGTFTVSQPLSVTNEAAISLDGDYSITQPVLVENGGLLRLGGQWQAQEITVRNAALELTGPVDVSQLSVVAFENSTIHLVNDVDLTGQVIEFGDDDPQWFLGFARPDGRWPLNPHVGPSDPIPGANLTQGTIRATGSKPLVITGHSRGASTRFETDIVITGDGGLSLSAGATIAGPHAIQLLGGTMSLDNTSRFEAPVDMFLEEGTIQIWGDEIGRSYRGDGYLSANLTVSIGNGGGRINSRTYQTISEAIIIAQSPDDWLEIGGNIENRGQMITRNHSTLFVRNKALNVGTIEVDGGTFLGYELTNHGIISLKSGLLDVSFLDLTNGELEIIGGELDFYAITGNLNNPAAALVTPMSLEGSLAQGDDAALRIRAGMDSDIEPTIFTFDITGQAQLSGSLLIDAEEVFLAGPDFSAVILHADGGITGQFSNLIDGRVYFDGGSFAVTYTDNDVVLDNFLVPEPTTATLLLIGGMAGLSRRRHR